MSKSVGLRGKILSPLPSALLLVDVRALPLLVLQSADFVKIEIVLCRGLRDVGRPNYLPFLRHLSRGNGLTGLVLVMRCTL
jgi:hypothetical protein